MITRVAAGFAALLLACTATARADSITIVQDTRQATAIAHVNDANGDDLKQAQANAQDVMSLSVPVTTGTSSGQATASLISSYADPFRMSGTGAASITYESLRWTAFASVVEYAVMFTTTDPLNYMFLGTFSGASSEQSPDPTSTHRAFWNVALRGTGGISGWEDKFAAFGTAPDSRTFTGTLNPGQYFLDVVAAASAFTHMNLGSTGTGYAGFDFTMHFRPAGSGGPPAATPEPASLLLVGAGLIAVARRCRRAFRRFPI